MTKLSENFNRKEFACKCGCGFDTVDKELVDVLEDVRGFFGKPINITSGCRCDSYNKSIHGSKNSKHKIGRASDIIINGVDPIDVYFYLDGKYGDTYGIGKYNSFTHIDTRFFKARW